MEEPILTGVAHDRSEAKVTVVGIPDHPGYAAKIFRAVADADVNIDMVLQNVSKIENSKTDITFTCPRDAGPAAVAKLDAMKAPVCAAIPGSPPHSARRWPKSASTST